MTQQDAERRFYEFQAWMTRLRAHMLAVANVEPFDISDYPYYERWIEGYSIKEVVKDALLEDGFPLELLTEEYT